MDSLHSMKWRVKSKRKGLTIDGLVLWVEALNLEEYIVDLFCHKTLATFALKWVVFLYLHYKDFLNTFHSRLKTILLKQWNIIDLHM